VKKRRPVKPDAVREAEAIVAFYQKRLDEAEERLGQAIVDAEERARPRVLPAKF
jgi:hypothetical protein